MTPKEPVISTQPPPAASARQPRRRRAGPLTLTIDIGGTGLKARALEDILKRPVRVVNDAEVQGLAVIAGQGFELVITLGTGVGSALFQDGSLLPHLELSQHPVRGRKTYDQYLGDAARKRLGTRKWNRRVRRVIGILETVFNFDRLYLGGGNAARIDFQLGRRVRVVDNAAGLLGGIALWKRSAERPALNTLRQRSTPTI